VQHCIAYARRVNPDIEVLQLSAAKGEGFAVLTGSIETCLA
jgi:hypothetical protein